MIILPDGQSSINRDVNQASVPAALQDRPQWINWRPEWVPERGKYTKIPTDPHTGYNISPTDPAQWRTFTEVIATANGRYGIGFSFSADDPFVGFDIDTCYDQDGRLHPAVSAFVTQHPTYWEKSPSGAGIHGIFLGTLPHGLRCRAVLPGMSITIELYDQGRYFTVTGGQIGQGEITPLPQALVELFRDVAEEEASHREEEEARKEEHSAHAAPLSEAEQQHYLARVIGSLLADTALDQLWAGDMSDHRDDHSAADLAPCRRRQPIVRTWATFIE